VQSALVPESAGSVSVVSCSGFTDRNHPSIREMEEMAWLLRSDARRNQVGFVQGKRLPDEERFVLEED
jgi:hypothetical protein